MDEKPIQTDTHTTADDGKTERVEGKDRFVDRIELTEEDAFEKTGFAFPSWKKWTIISVIFVIQCSMNLNASLYANGVSGLTKEFGISKQAARVGQCLFLVCYAFGCELWAPWSEEVCGDYRHE